MSILQMRRAIAEGGDPTETFLQMTSPAATVSQLSAGVRGLEASLEGVDQPLAQLVSTPGVTDVLINDPHTAWIDFGRGLQLVPGFELEKPVRVRQMAVRMAAAAGQRLDDATPIVDATLPSGIRLHAVLPPLSGDCTLISLRVPTPVALPMSRLVDTGMVSSWMVKILCRLVEAKVSGIITGATGTGKTTLLASLLGLAAPEERLICIEEVSELRPNHPHVVHLQARAANVQNAGAVTLSDLVKAAMRMRPDRLILGEARGSEVREMLSALNTGHRGGWATLHANSALEVPARLEALGALAGMNRDTVCAQALPAFDVLVELQRELNQGQVCRRVVRLARLRRSGEAKLGAETLLEVKADGTVQYEHAWSEFAKKFDLETPCLEPDHQRKQNLFRPDFDFPPPPPKKMLTPGKTVPFSVNENVSSARTGRHWICPELCIDSSLKPGQSEVNTPTQRKTAGAEL